LYLGNLNSTRDWGHAKDYVEAMYLMLQQETAEDYVIATGESTSVRDFVRLSFEELGITLSFKGEGENETGIVEKLESKEIPLTIGQEVLAIDKRYFRPTEVDALLGNPEKAKTKLGWKPKYDLKMLVKEMIQADLALFQRDKYLQVGGHQIFNYYE
jgi:GDPmannose 4,6-dehydratase